MKFKIIASIVVIVLLVLAAILFSGGGQPVDADGNPIPAEYQQ